jgi:Protein of unknown function (DUF4232)
MNLQSISVLRRVGVAAGVTAAAALGGGVAMGATASGTAKPASTVAACATSQLRIWYAQPNGAAAGSSYFPLEFTNTGTTSCALDGYPGISGVNADGDQLGSPATWNPEVTPSSVVLAPGGTAHVILQLVDVANYPTTICEPTAAIGLRVYPPNQKASVVLPYNFEACAKTGANYLGVDAVNAGVGIPFYTNS